MFGYIYTKETFTVKDIKGFNFTENMMQRKTQSALAALTRHEQVESVTHKPSYHLMTREVLLMYRLQMQRLCRALVLTGRRLATWACLNQVFRFCQQ